MRDKRRQPEAIKFFERVYEARRKKLGDDDPTTLAAKENVAAAYGKLDNYDRAIPLYKEVLDTRLKLPGSDNLAVLQTMRNLASAHQSANQRPKALELFQKILETRTKSQGADHEDTLNAANDLGALFTEVGRFPEAIDTFQKILDALAKKKEWDQQKLTLEVIQCNLANAYMAARQPDKAIPLYKKGIEAWTKKHGADDENTLKFTQSLSAAYFNTGRYAEAIPLVEHIRDVQVKRGDADSEDGLTVQFNLAVLYRSTGRPADAVPILERIHEVKVKKYSADDSRALSVLAELANAYCDAKYGEKGLAAFRAFLDSQRKVAPTDQPFWAGNLAKASLKLLSCGQYAAAEEFLRESLAISEKKEPDAWTTFYRHSMLGAALLGQAKYADAEPLLLKGYEGLKEREKSIPKEVPTRIPEALDRLVELYTATNKPDAANKWRAERAKYPPTPLPLAPPPREQK